MRFMSEIKIRTS